MWIRGDCANHVLYRTAVTNSNGIVNTDDVLLELGKELRLPPIPNWISSWISAEKLRPWPPMQTE